MTSHDDEEPHSSQTQLPVTVLLHNPLSSPHEQESTTSNVSFAPSGTCDRYGANVECRLSNPGHHSETSYHHIASSDVGESISRLGWVFAFLRILAEFKLTLSDAPTAPYPILWQMHTQWLEGHVSATDYQAILDAIEQPWILDLVFGTSEDTDWNLAANIDSNLYSPIGFGEIRLVVLLPHLNANVDEEIECFLCHTKLERKPTYEALSYVWGDPKKRIPIKLNGRDFQVTENLYDALKELRHLQREEVRVLWIDAICINQSSIPERNEQVRQMGRIYSGAKEVIVWLGKESRTSRRALEFIEVLPILLTRLNVRELEDIEGIPRQLLENFALRDGYDSEFLKRVPKETIIKLAKSPNFFQSWLAVADFLDRPWWGRVWIIQEIVLAAKATIYCGKMSLKWNRLGILCHIVTRCVGTLHTIQNIEDIHNVRDILPMHLAFRGLLKANTLHILKGSSIVPFSEILIHLQQCRTLNPKATDPRDYIYAFLGLVDGGLPVSADYSLSLLECYTQFAITHMQHTRTLRVFSDINPPEGCSRLRRLPLPSWTPDWRIGLGAGSRRTTFGTIGDLPKVDDVPVFRASLMERSPVPFMVTNCGREITLSGFTVGVIKYIWNSTDGRSVADTVKYWKNSVKMGLNKHYHGGISIENAFWRTILLDMCPTDNTRMPSRLKDGVGSFCQIPPRGAEEDRLLAFLDRKNNPYGLHGLELSTSQLFYTSTEYMGLGMAGIKQDDIVVVLLGGNVPYILRKAPHGKYFYVSDCYVHGVMDGEIISERTAAGQDYETFTLV